KFLQRKYMKTMPFLHFLMFFQRVKGILWWPLRSISTGLRIWMRKVLLRFLRLQERSRLQSRKHFRQRGQTSESMMGKLPVRKFLMYTYTLFPEEKEMAGEE